MHSAKKDLIDKIIKAYPTLSPKKRRVADLIIKDYKKIFLMTAKEIAQECEISEPTIIRFAVDLGFTGYAEFLQYMKGLLHTELTAVERLAKASQHSDERTILKRYCQNAIHNLKNLMDSVSEKEFKKAARTIYKAETVYVVGYRASSALAYYFGYLLKKVRENVFVDTTLSWDLMDSITRNGKSTLLFVMAFPRYPRRTISLLEYAKKYKVKILGLSDTPKSPIIALSDHYIIIDLEAVSFTDPFAHIIAFLGALVHEIIFIDNEKAVKYLSKFDNGVKNANEFFTEERIDERLEYKLDGPYLTSLWPQKKRG